MIDVDVKFNQADLEQYKQSLALYLSLSKKDAQTLINKKAVSLRLRIMRQLNQNAPSKAKLKSEFMGRGYRMRLHGKAKELEQITYKTKEEYKAAFSQRGMRWNQKIAQLSTKYLSRMIGNDKELKRRFSASKFLGSVMTIPNHTANIGGNGQLKKYGKNGKLYTTVTLQTNTDNSLASVRIVSTAPKIRNIIDKFSILQSALQAENADMAKYIAQKLEQNKKQAKL